MNSKESVAETINHRQPDNEYKVLLDCVLAHDKQGISQIFEDFERSLQEFTSVSQEYIYTYLFETIVAISRSLIENGYNTGIDFNTFTYEFFSSHKNLCGALTLCNKYMQKLSDSVLMLESTRKKCRFGDVIKYIQENLTRNLSLHTVSNQFYYNPSYFCRMFKKETGLRFVDYINQQRVELAKRIFATTDMPAYKVCEYVGYKDYRYFASVFKKYAKNSPHYYKKRGKGKSQTTGTTKSKD